MSKETERKKLVESITSDDFKECCEEQGFTVCSSSQESEKTKKKANL